MSRYDDYRHYTRIVQKYAKQRVLDLEDVYGTGACLRLSDGGFTTVDVMPWSGRYFVRETNYGQLAPELNLTEREGESDSLPGYYDEIEAWLDKIFYAVDLA